jgi:ribosomal protein S6--L-glutamate ligase
MMQDDQLICVGWEEWCALPELGLTAIKAKIDTGAKTSALHAFDIKLYRYRGRRFVRFAIHPLQKYRSVVLSCRALVVDRRYVIDSGGHREKRYVIRTRVHLGNHSWEIEVTLTNRDTMAFRMLLGREALRGYAYVNPARSFCQRKLTSEEALRLYLEQNQCIISPQ